MNAEEMKNTLKICAATAYAHGVKRTQFMEMAEQAYRQANPSADEEEPPPVPADTAPADTVALADDDSGDSKRGRRR